MSKSKSTPSKRELNNLCISKRIKRYVYDHQFCTITSISKGNEIPKNTATIRKHLNKLLDANYIKSLSFWNKEYFYTSKFPNSKYMSQKTFFIKNHEMFDFFDSHKYLPKTDVYKEFVDNLGVLSFGRLVKNNFKRRTLEYNRGLNQNQNTCDQIFRKLLCIYHKKMLVYIRDENYKSQKSKTYVKIDVYTRMQDVTRFILTHVTEFAKQINQYDEDEFLKYAQNIAPILDVEYETTSEHLINSTEYLTTITHKLKLKRKILTLTERIKFWQSHFNEYFTSDYPGNIPYRITRVIKPIMKPDVTPDFAKMIQIAAMESGCDVLFAENYAIEEFLEQWMKKHQLLPEIK